MFAKGVSYVLALALGLGAVPAWAGECASCNAAADCKDCKGCKCITPPAADCPDCSEPCCTKHRVHTVFGEDHAQKLIDAAGHGCCKDRIKAVKKLGHHLHADFCCNPDVLAALVKALLCDTCWEVRRAAAWSITKQNARVPQGILALYLASKLDPHFLVRDGAAEALDVLVVCRRDCYQDLFKNGDELVKQLRGKYQPTSGDCISLDALASCCAGAPAAAAPALEAIPAPQPK